MSYVNHTIDPRQQHGEQIAAMLKVRLYGNGWLVPSQ